jgi:hypothetical protein
MLVDSRTGVTQAVPQKQLEERSSHENNIAFVNFR